ncbi:MAG: hypothetical protein AB8G16_11345 [Gammaproteobacteria bacterium]
MTDIPENDRPHVIKDAKGKRPAFFEAEGVDQLMSMVMVMASELAVMRDRIDAQERVALEHGIDLAKGIEKIEFDETALQEREAWRQSFFERLFYLARKDATEQKNGQTTSGYKDIIDDIAVN